MIEGWRSTTSLIVPAKNHHHCHGQNDGDDHDADFVNHAYCGDYGIEGKHGVEKADLHEHGSQGRGGGRFLVFLVAFEPVVDLMRALREQK